MYLFKFFTVFYLLGFSCLCIIMYTFIVFNEITVKRF